jgi:hypothetical protein
MAIEPRTAKEARQARDAVWNASVVQLLANPEKFRMETDELARKECPWMTQAQLDASWEYLAQLMGL